MKRQFKKTSFNLTKSDVLTQTLVLLPIEWNNKRDYYLKSPSDDLCYKIFICKDHYEQFLDLWDTLNI